MRTTRHIFNRLKSKSKQACISRLSNALSYCDKRAFQLDGFKSYLYVIQCHEFIKIGIADNPKRRLGELQVGCPYKLTLIRCFASKTPRADERRLHELLRKHHERGEWFRLTDGMRKLLNDFDDGLDS